MKRKKVSKLKIDLFKAVKKASRERMRCIMYPDFGVCGGAVQASHIKAEGAWPNLKYDPHNIFPMCYRHHIHKWHKDITECSEWFKKNYPADWQYLEEQKKSQHIDFNNPVILERLWFAIKKGYEAYEKAYAKACA